MEPKRMISMTTVKAVTTVVLVLTGETVSVITVILALTGVTVSESIECQKSVMTRLLWTGGRQTGIPEPEAEDQEGARCVWSTSRPGSIVETVSFRWTGILPSLPSSSRSRGYSRSTYSLHTSLSFIEVMLSLPSDMKALCLVNIHLLHVNKLFTAVTFPGY